jgi:hypothetical protein
MKLAFAAFQGVVLSTLQFGYAGGVDVKPNHSPLLAEFNGQGQAHITQADDGDGGIR